MSALTDKIIELLQDKHDAFLGMDGQKSRDDFKDGLSWAIGTIETLSSQEGIREQYDRIHIEDWSDLPEKKGMYWTTNKNSTAKTMVETSYEDTKDSRGFWRATVGSWLKPI